MRLRREALNGLLEVAQGADVPYLEYLSESWDELCATPEIALKWTTPCSELQSWDRTHVIPPRLSMRRPTARYSDDVRLLARSLRTS